MKKKHIKQTQIALLPVWLSFFTLWVFSAKAIASDENTEFVDLMYQTYAMDSFFHLKAQETARLGNKNATLQGISQCLTSQETQSKARNGLKNELTDFQQENHAHIQEYNDFLKNGGSAFYQKAFSTGMKMELNKHKSKAVIQKIKNDAVNSITQEQHDYIAKYKAKKSFKPLFVILGKNYRIIVPPIQMVLSLQCAKLQDKKEQNNQNSNSEEVMSLMNGGVYSAVLEPATLLYSQGEAHDVTHKPTKKTLLREKFLKASLAFQAFNDKRNYSELDQACVYTENKKTMSTFLKMSDNLSEKHSEYVDLWLNNLDFIGEITQKIYLHPKELDFDYKDLSASSALQILSKRDAQKIEKIIYDKRYSPLLTEIGLPSTNEANELQDNMDVMLIPALAKISLDTICKK